MTALTRASRRSLRRFAWVVVGMGLLVTGPVKAAEFLESDEPVPRDCRYPTTKTTISASTSGDRRNLAFPQDDIFRPLVADPKQPQFFLSYQRVQLRNQGQTVNAGVTGVGDTFGLWGKRDGNCNGVQFGIQGAVFAQFNLDAYSHDLINADYVLGFPLTWRQGPLSARVRLYHQSSHLGDEFLLSNPGVNRINLTFEEVEALLSLDVPWFRVYGGGGYLVHREPALERSKLQWGIELRRPDIPSPIFRNIIEDLQMVPVAGADFKAFEELGWNINTSVVAGLEWHRPGSTRRLRLLLTYYHGFSPYGQFFNQKLETFGGGLYFHF